MPVAPRHAARQTATALPRPGRTVRVARAGWAAIAVLVPLLVLASSPTVAATGVQSGEQLQAQAEHWLADRHPWQGPDYQVTLTAEALDPRLRLAACDGPAEFSLPPGQRVGARTTVMASCSSPVAWRLLMPVRIAAQTRALVARQAIAPGTVLRASLFEVTWRDVAGVRQGHVAPQELSGLESRLLIAAGSILSRSLTRPETLVRRGQQVTLHARSAVLSISMAAESLADGGLGERIKVRNLSSRQVLEGSVEADGSVSVAF